MSWFHSGYTDICVMGFSHGLIQPLLVDCIDVHLTGAFYLIFSPFFWWPHRRCFQRDELESTPVKANYFIRQKCLICRFVSYYVNMPPELLRSFSVSVALGLGVVRRDSWSALKSEPCKSNQLSHFFPDKMLVNENTFSKSHSIMRNLNWKQKPFVYYEFWGVVVTCHP